tara:strand:- start:1217 stop:2293 length:1077 start_codon:yes stop_codon:yes gene_type:complete
MKRNAFVLLICITLILAPGSSVANPGGNGDANRDYSCGGSCHGDPALSMPSDATIEITLGNEAFSGQAVAIHVTIDGISTPSQIIGIFILGSLNGNSDTPEDHGWHLIQDPNGGSSNYIETKASSSGSATVTWVLLSPESSGSHILYAEIHHGSYAGDKAFTGVSQPFEINVQDVPDGLPGLADDWVAPSFRVSGDNSPLTISTRNSTDISVEWMLDGEWNPTNAELSCKEHTIDVCNDWQVSIPATMGEANILYRVTTYNGTFAVEQPWLKMGTAPPPFEGEIWSARAHSFAFALLVISFLVTLQARLYPRDDRNDLDQTQIMTSSEMIRSEENPGWLWNSEIEEWVEDPEYQGGGN